MSLSTGIYFYLTIAAVTSSTVGDAFLVLPVVFPIGILAFGIAQILYALMFGARGLPNSSLSTLVFMFILVAGFCTGIFLSIHRPFGKLFKENMNTALIVLMMAYIAMISTMLWMALLQHAVFGSVQSLLALVGGTLFFMSDLSILLSAIFSSHWIFKRRIFVMVTYYAAQLFIVISILLLLCKHNIHV